MDALVIRSEKGQDVTTSLLVAEVFGKRHDDVLKAIRNLDCTPEFTLRNFAEGNYTHPKNNQQFPMYEMTKDGFSFLAMGFTGTKASIFKETFINEFNKREALLQNDDFILFRAFELMQNRNKALEATVNNQKEELALAETTIKEQAPMVAHYNKVLSADNGHLATAMAQMFGIGAPTFNRLLDDWGIQRKVGGDWVLTAKYMKQAKVLTVIRPVPYLNSQGVTQTKNELRWTEAGRVFLVAEFEKRGYNIKAA